MPRISDYQKPELPKVLYLFEIIRPSTITFYLHFQIIGF